MGLIDALKLRLSQNETLRSLYHEAVVRLHRSDHVAVGEFIVHFDPADRYIPARLILEGGYEVQEVALVCPAMGLVPINGLVQLTER